MEKCTICGTAVQRTTKKEGYTCGDCRRKKRRKEAAEENERRRIARIRKELEGAKHIDERTTNMILLRRGGLTLEEIGDHYGLSRERVRQILERATKTEQLKEERITKYLERNPNANPKMTRARITKGLTFKAVETATNIPAVTVRAYETEEMKRYDLEVASKLAKLYGLTTAEILRIEETKDGRKED